MKTMIRKVNLLLISIILVLCSVVALYAAIGTQIHDTYCGDNGGNQSAYCYAGGEADFWGGKVAAYHFHTEIDLYHYGSYVTSNQQDGNFSGPGAVYDLFVGDSGFASPVSTPHRAESFYSTLVYDNPYTEEDSASAWNYDFRSSD
jgi:hypothetical protein